MIKLFKTLLITIFVFCTGFYSCKTPKFELQDFFGDWMLPFDSIRSTDNILGISIIGDSIYSVSKDGLSRLQGKISLTNDTLSFFDVWVKKTCKYIIEKRTTDSLILINNGIRYRYHNQRLEYNSNLKFSKITLILGKVSTPDMKMVLDSAGNVEYVIPKKKISKVLKLDSDKRLLIDSLFKSSCISNTSTDGWYKENDDGYENTMIFEYDDKVSVLHSIQFSMPLRINPIFYQMIKVIDCKIF